MSSSSLYETKSNAQRLAFAPLAFHAALALRDLGILEALAKRRKKGATPDEVAAETGLPIYGVKVLLESGFVSDLVSLEGETYRISDMGRFILRDPMTRANMDFTADICYRGMEHLQETMKTGRPAGLRELGPWKTIYEGLSSLPKKAQDSWFAFDHFYSDELFPSALPVVADYLGQSPKRLLDIGGNTGKFSMACAAEIPNVQVTLLDLPGQIAMAKENAADAGLADRIDCQAIDFLDRDAQFPKGFDAIWMSQFLDCFSEAQIVSILERARAALAPGGKVFITDSYWDLQEHDAARFCLVMTSLYFACLANGESKMYHSDDMRRCIEEAGLSIERSIDDLTLSHTMFVCTAASEP